MVDMTDNRDRIKRIMQELQSRFPANAINNTKKNYEVDDEEWPSLPYE